MAQFQQLQSKLCEFGIELPEEYDDLEQLPERLV